MLSLEIIQILRKPILNQPRVLGLLKQILKSRLIPYYQLKEKIDLEDKDLTDILKQLQGEGLIKKKAAYFWQLDIFYPSIDALVVEKFL